MATTYEWVCELESDDGDIVDCRFAPTRIEAEALRDPDYKCRIGLVKHEDTDNYGGPARGYAYLDADGNLPAEFDGDTSPHIPARYRSEVSA